MAAPKGKRPITRALEIVESTEYNSGENGYVLKPSQRAELIRILKSRDASSDTPDSKRRRQAKKATRR